MVDHRETMFEFINLKELEGSYRMLQVTGLPREPVPYKQLGLLATKVRRELRRPAVLVRQEGGYAIAIPGEAPLPVLRQALVPHVATLVPEQQVRPLRFSSLEEGERQVAIGLLEGAIQDRLRQDNRLWGSGRLYFEKRPLPGSNGMSEVDIYQGFRVSVVPDRDGRIFVALDITYRYIDSLWLTQRSPGRSLSSFGGRHCLYHFGPQLYEVQLQGPTGNPIQEDFFTHPDTGEPVDVYSYTKEKWGGGQWPHVQALSPESPGILYRYPGNRDMDRHGAAALCKLIYPTEDPGVKKLHSRSIHLPEYRFSGARAIVEKYLIGLELQGTHISIASESLLSDLKAFPIPDLRYGRGAVLHVKRHQADAGVDLQDYPRGRMQHLLDPEKGYWDTSSFRAQYLLLPMSLERRVAEGFSKEFTAEMGRLSSREYTPVEILYDDSSCRSLYEYVQEIKGRLAENGVSAGYVLLVLPLRTDNATIRDLHNFLKKELWPQVQFQCAQGQEIVARHPFQGKARSYLRYLALGMLLVNRKWPMVLATPLNHEVYVGIDVLNGRAGFTFLYRNGEECYFNDYRSSQPEKLTTKQIRTVLYQHLKKDFERLNLRPKAIVVHRDGMAFDTELKGMEQAIRNLKDEGLLDLSAQLAVVEIHKRSALPIRIARELPGRGLVNPRIGTYRVLNGHDGLVCTTGYPFDLQGTAQPLHCRIVYGDFDVEKVLGDVFSLSQLAYSAPDRPCRLPLTIKLSDAFLEPIASETDLESALYGDDEDVLTNEGNGGGSLLDGSMPTGVQRKEAKYG